MIDRSHGAPWTASLWTPISWLSSETAEAWWEAVPHCYKSAISRTAHLPDLKWLSGKCRQNSHYSHWGCPQLERYYHCWSARSPAYSPPLWHSLRVCAARKSTPTRPPFRCWCFRFQGTMMLIQTWHSSPRAKPKTHKTSWLSDW